MDLVRRLKIELANVKVDIVVCPPYTALAEVSRYPGFNIRLGTQT
jgi:triosephosphate isomerase